MRDKNGAITRFNNWLFGNPMPKEYFPDVHKYEDLELYEIRNQVRHIAEFCMILLITLTTLYFFGSNLLNGAPEPDWWLNIAEPWLLSLF
jgi:hypothetical protein